MFDDLDLTIFEITDDEVNVVRRALEKLIASKSKIKYGNADLVSVLALLEEAFKITEEYRQEADPYYVTVDDRNAKAYQDSIETPLTDSIS
jgi:hypothetical protein